MSAPQVDNDIGDSIGNRIKSESRLNIISSSISVSCINESFCSENVASTNLPLKQHPSKIEHTRVSRLVIVRSTDRSFTTKPSFETDDVTNISHSPTCLTENKVQSSSRLNIVSSGHKSSTQSSNLSLVETLELLTLEGSLDNKVQRSSRLNIVSSAHKSATQSSNLSLVKTLELSTSEGSPDNEVGSISTFPIVFSPVEGVVEEWLPCPGYPGGQVSSFGQLMHRTGRISNPAPNSSGYTVAHIPYEDTKRVGKTVRLHTLIATAFIPNPENKPFVNHINGKRSDNRVVNLEWVTSAENSNKKTVFNETRTGRPVIQYDLSLPGTPAIAV